MRSLLKTIIIAPVKLYAYAVSPLFGPSCRFHPTCSAYAIRAIDEHGVLKGLPMALRRLSRCHPWSKGPFYDPVPEINKETSGLAD